jgi:hypothetical protein
MNEKEKENMDDLFLQALIKNDGLKVPSKSFTKIIMDRLPNKQIVIEESSHFIARNLTLLIFLLIAIINVVIVYFLWPYISIWLPENNFINIILDSISFFARDYISRIIEQSATVSLLFIIGIGGFVLLGGDAVQKFVGKIIKRPSV